MLEHKRSRTILCKMKPHNQIKRFYILQFLERPYASLDEFIYIPASDVIQINKNNYTVFTYPIDPCMKNKMNYDKWPYFLGKLKGNTDMLRDDSVQTAREVCKNLNSWKPDDEDRDLNDPEDNPADLEKNGKKRKAHTEALDDDNILTPKFMKTLTNELESYEKQQIELTDSEKIIYQKSCLLKEFIEKFKSYNNEENTVDDKHQKLVEIIKEKDKQINELKFHLEGKKVANDKENSDTQWTLRYPEETNDAFELLDNSGVYVNGVACCYITRAAKTRTALARMLLHEVFTDKALKTCNLYSLDSHARNILVEAVRFVSRPSVVGFDNVSKENILCSLKNRLFYINKIPA